MAAPRAPAPLTRHLAVETPEHVVLDYEVAGLGSRAAAALVDQALVLLLLAAVRMLAMLGARAGLTPGSLGPAVLLLVGFGIWYGYFIFFEALRQGQTPGKRLVGLRVVMATGHAVTTGAAVVRNLLRTADFLPPPYLLGAALVALHPRSRRLGDLVAGTVVVRDRPQDAPSPRAAVSAAVELTAPLLTDEEYALVQQAMARLDTLAPGPRARVLHALATRLDAALPAGGPAAERLARLLEAETARRASGLGASGRSEQLVARQRDRWREFEALVRRAQRTGLDGLAADELPDFAARYREVAADLARLRTYGAPRDTMARVERLAAAGHNLLYRRAARGGGVLHTLAVECPAAVVAARGYVLAGFLAFMVPGTVGYQLLRHEPAMAERVLPVGMLERAEAGAERRAQGGRYVSVAVEGRPFTASWLIVNNVRVALFCFAGGIFLGVGALLLLAFNGLSLGATAGHFVNVGLGGYLGEFVLGHGVLELTAIWIAGGAGFLLGTTLVAPGALRRGDALQLAGQRAVRMLGAAVTCLVVAGCIEGFVSTSEAGWTGRVLASALSLVFLASYLAFGAVATARRSGSVGVGQ